MKKIAVGMLLILVSLIISCSRAVYARKNGAAEIGIASWYGKDFHGRPTSSSEIYNMNDMTAAHKTLPFGTRVMVINLENGRSAVVRINDRGPFIRGRIIDLSYAAARILGIVGPGTARVRLEILNDSREKDRRSPLSIQVGAFVIQENAYALKRELEKVGEDVYISTVEIRSQIFYRVRIPAKTRKEADRIARRLASNGFPVVIIDE
jgi:rare lipoprotein A